MKFETLAHKTLHKFLCSDNEIAGKFKRKSIQVAIVLLLTISALKALITCSQFIEHEQYKTRMKSIIHIEKVSKEITTPNITLVLPIMVESPKVTNFNIVEKEEVVISTPTIYDTYTKEEVEMLEHLVEAEATSGGIEEKINVANVVFNRLENEEFPNTIEGVIFQKSQFSCVSDGRFYSEPITESTKEAVVKAFFEKDTTDGALYFCNQKDVKNLSTLKWFKTLTYIMTDKINHSFYK